MYLLVPLAIPNLNISTKRLQGGRGWGHRQTSEQRSRVWSLSPMHVLPIWKEGCQSQVRIFKFLWGCRNKVGGILQSSVLFRIFIVGLVWTCPCLEVSPSMLSPKLHPVPLACRKQPASSMHLRHSIKQTVNYIVPNLTWTTQNYSH